MLVFALILLFFANHQSPDVLTQTFGAEQAQNGNMLATFALAFFMSIFILYGFDTAGTFGEETIDASRQAPRGVLSSVLVSGAVGVVFLLAIILSLKDIPADDGRRAWPASSRSRPTIQANLTRSSSAGSRSARSTCSSSSPRSSSARWRSRAPRPG